MADAEQSKPPETKIRLPDPLTLEHALSLADSNLPDLLVQDAKVLEARANEEIVDASNSFRAYLDIGAYAADEESNQFASRRDHVRAGIYVTKDIYDFGHQADRLEAAKQLTRIEELKLLDARGNKRMQIMRAFFDVLLSDLKFSQYNEELAIRYIRLDRARTRKELGREDDVKIAELDFEFQKLRGKWAKSENQQRETRARLAELLNTPDNLPGNLTTPVLKDLKRKLPEVEELQQKGLQNNLLVKSYQHELKQAETQLTAARSADNARIQASFQAHQYESDFGSTDEVAGDLSLKYDFYNPRHSANEAESLAKVYNARASLQKVESDLRQTILALWHKIEELKMMRQEAEALLLYRELFLERHRALYEMEASTDLGLSMAELTRAMHRVAEVDYALTVAWYQMDLLTGEIKLESSVSFQPIGE